MVAAKLRGKAVECALEACDASIGGGMRRGRELDRSNHVDACLAPQPRLLGSTTSIYILLIACEMWLSVCLALLCAEELRAMRVTSVDWREQPWSIWEEASPEKVSKELLESDGRSAQWNDQRVPP